MSASLRVASRARPTFVATVALAALLLVPSAARADDPALDRAGGLNASSSGIPAGLVDPSAAKVLEYVKSVSALNVVASYHADPGKDASTCDGKRGLFHPGPIKSATVKGGADIKLSAGFSKKGGAARPTLDQIKLEADGVRFGPWNALAVQKVEINGDGSINVKLNRWIPEIKVSKVERKSNGDVELKANWWAPGVIIKKNGDVEITKLGFHKKVGHIDPNLFAVWPPTMEEFLALGALFQKNRSGTSLATSSEGGRNLLEKLAGKLSWDVFAKVDDAPVPTGHGNVAQGDGELSIHGDARVDSGAVRTVGDKNLVHLAVKVGDAKLGDANRGVDLDEGAVTLDGRYRVEAPITSDPTKKLVVDFDGRAAFAGKGSDARLALPNGARVRVGSVDASGDVGVHVGLDGSSKTFKLDDGHYAASVSGPLSVTRLGPIGALELDGRLSSRGTIAVGRDGLARLRGNAKGGLEVETDGFVNFMKGGEGTSTTLKKGSKVSVDLDEVLATALVPAATGDFGGRGQLRDASAKGGVDVSGALADTTVRKDGVTVVAPSTAVSVSVDGKARLAGGSFSADAHVAGDTRLEKNASVSYARNGTTAATTLTSGSHLGLDASVSTSGRAGQKPTTRIAGRIDGALGDEGLDLDHGPLGVDLNDRVKVGVHAPFAATIGPDGKPVLDPKRTSLTTPVRVDLRKGTRVSFRAFGKDSSLVLDTDGSYVELTGAIELGPDGKPRVKELKNVKVRLQVGQANATVLGQAFPGIQIGKAIELDGRVAFGSNGIDIHGNAGLANAGSNGPPILHVSF